MMKPIWIALMVSASMLCTAVHAELIDEFVGQFASHAQQTPKWSVKMVNHGYELLNAKKMLIAYPATSQEQQQLWQKMSWDTTFAAQASCLITPNQTMLCHLPPDTPLKTEYFVVDDNMNFTAVTRLSEQ